MTALLTLALSETEGTAEDGGTKTDSGGRGRTIEEDEENYNINSGKC